MGQPTIEEDPRFPVLAGEEVTNVGRGPRVGQPTIEEDPRFPVLAGEEDPRFKGKKALKSEEDPRFLYITKGRGGKNAQVQGGPTVPLYNKRERKKKRTSPRRTHGSSI